MVFIMKIITAPAHWASALINNDRSGLDHRERLDISQWLRDNDNPRIASCSEESYIGQFEGKLCEILNYYTLES